MKTITQYREEVANMMTAIGNIDAQCTVQNRDPSPEDLTMKNSLLDQIEAHNSTIATMERQERAQKTLDTPDTPVTVPTQTPGMSVGSNRAEKDNFLSLGEQLAAVYHANPKVDGYRDPRLAMGPKNAATGLNETVPSDGGFLVQSDFSTTLLADVFETGLLASRCTEQPISPGANGTTINGVDETSRASSRWGGIVSYWADEAAEKTASKPKFRQIELKLKKLIGLCYATDENLQDAAQLESIIRTGFASEFGFKLDDAIVRGNGAGQPLGILNAGSLVTVAKEAGQPADTIMAENIMNMRSRLFAASRANSVWLINQDIEPQLHSMSLAVGTGGLPVFLPANGLNGSPYDTLYGRPIIPIEQCSTLGDAGDIILADLSGYILATKGTMQSDMSIHVRFVYDESAFRFILRVDGEPQRSTPLTPYQGSATQSHFVTLAERA